MRIRRTRTYKLFRETKTKAINITTSLVMVASSLGGALPIVLTGKAFAASLVTVCPAVTATCTHTSIQSAIDDASSGDTIDIQAGTYDLTSQVNVNKSVTIEGEHGVHINVNYAGTGFVVTAPGATIKNLSIVTYNTVGETILIGVQAANTTISNNTLNGHYTFANNSTSRGIVVSGYANETISGNYFNTLRQPAYINNGSSGTITNNYAEGTKGWVVEGGSNFAITGNTWGTSSTANGNERNAVDIAIIPGSPDATTDNYTDVMALSQANHSAMVDNQLIGAPSVPHTLSDAYVDDSAAAGGNGYWQSPFQTIQAGLTAVATGGRVHVAAGTYASANVNKTVTLKGAQAGVTAVSGRTHSSSDESVLAGSTSYSPSLNVTADNVVIDGFDFGPATDGASSGPIGVDLGSTAGATVTNSIFEHNQRGISLNGASNVAISNDLIAYNNADPQNNAGVWGDNVSGITIENSELDGASNTAINLAGSSSVKIQSNVFKNNGNTAVIWNDSNVTFSGNIGTDFTGSGLFVTGSQHVTVSSNSLTDGATFNGISFSTASGNTSSDVTVTGNTITGFQNGINVGSGALSDVPSVQANNLSGNTGAGVNAPSSASTLVNATDNWWGAASGPADTVSGDGSTLDKNTNGTGSAAIGAVKYSPWCTTADCAADSSVAPGTPTNLTAKFQYDSSNVADGTTLNKTSKSGGNNLELEWDTPAGWVNGYHVITTYPNGTQNTGYQGPNTNAWLVPNGFGQHGQGKYTFQVVAVNNNGESAPSQTFTLYYDTTPPTATFTDAPANNAYVNGNFHVAGTAHDNVGLKAVAFDVRSQDGSTWIAGCVSGGSPVYSGTNNTDATLDCDINTAHLVSGTTYMLRIHAGDNAGYGNVNSDAVRYFTFDTSAPAAPANVTAKFQYDSSDVANGSTLNKTSKPGNNNLELLWNTPAGSWVTGHHILVTYPDGSTDLSYQGPNTNAWLAVYDGFGSHGQGKYVYQVVGVNPNGESAPSQEFVLYYDTQSPVAQFTQAPADNSHLNGNFHVEATASDNVALKSVGFDVRDPHDTTGNAWRAGCVAGTFALTYNADRTSATLSCDINTANLTDGTAYYVRVHAGDNAGYGSKDSAPLSVRNFTFDQTAPNAPTNLSWKTSTNVTVANNGYTNQYGGTASWQDSSNDVDHYIYKYWDDILGNQYKVGNEYTTTVGSTSLAGVFNQGEGVHHFCVEAVDAAGNTSACSTPFTITYDKTAPVVTITAPSTGDTLHGTVTVSGTVTDTNPDHYYFVVKDSHGTVVAGPGTVNHATVSDWNWDTTKVADGTYTIDLEARDKADNKDASSVQTITVIVDNKAPTGLTNLSPSDGAITTTAALTHVDWTDATDTHGPVSYYYEVSHSSATNSDGSFVTPVYQSGALADSQILTPGTPAGQYYWHVRAADALGNSTAWTATWNFTIDNTAPVVTVNTLSTTDTTPTVTGTVDDSSAAVAVKVNGHTYNATVNGTTWSAAVTDALPVGTYDVTATATDQAGNVGTDSTTNELTIAAVPHITFTNFSRQIAITGNTNNTGNTNGGNAGNNGTVLGASTNSGSNGQVKGDSTVNLKNVGTTQKGNFLVLGWWWLAVIAALGLGWFLLAAYRRSDRD